jgi:hypothetical protein
MHGTRPAAWGRSPLTSTIPRPARSRPFTEGRLDGHDRATPAFGLADLIRPSLRSVLAHH